MADNSQNTIPGGGGAIAPPSGNGFLDAFTKLSNIAVDIAGKVYGTYDSVRERELAAEIQKFNGITVPRQQLQASTQNAALNYLSTPANQQKILLYVGFVAFIAVGTIWAVRKVR